MHCTHAGLVYTVTVICGTAPVGVEGVELVGHRQLTGYCSLLSFSGPRGPEIPDPRKLNLLLPGAPTRFRFLLRRLLKHWGLAVRQTLHLVSDKPKRYKMF